jgi:cytochrome P450
MFDTILDEALEQGEVEFVDDVAAALPMRVFAELLGAPEGDHRYLVELGDRMLGQDDPEFALSPEVMEENRHLPFSNPAAQQMFEYGRKLADERRECPRDDIVTKLVEAEIEGCPLTQHEFDVYFLLLAVAGNETTRHSISSGVLALIENPDQFERLRAEPELIPLAANEILRWATPVHHFRRTATCDVEFGGSQIRENDKLSTWYISGNFDEEVFDDPYSFDVGRDPNPQMTFGPGGPHFCTGAHLARLEIEIVFEEMVKRVAAFEPTGNAERLQSNFFNGIKRMPLRLVPA